MRILGPLFLASVIATLSLRGEALPAQARTALASQPDLVSGADIALYREYVVRARAQGTTVYTAADEQTNYVIVVRTLESAVERHARWDDLIITRSGSGVVRLGRSATGMRDLAPGERRGGILVKATDLHLRAGDVARIPAGVPHSFTPDSGATFEYLLIKIRRPNKPLR